MHTDKELRQWEVNVQSRYRKGRLYQRDAALAEASGVSWRSSRSQNEGDRFGKKGGETMTHHRLYRLLLDQMYEQETFEIAELNIKMLHDVLVCSIKHQKGENYVPSQEEVWEELFLKSGLRRD